MCIVIFFNSYFGIHSFRGAKEQTNDHIQSKQNNQSTTAALVSNASAIKRKDLHSLSDPTLVRSSHPQNNSTLIRIANLVKK